MTFTLRVLNACLALLPAPILAAPFWLAPIWLAPIWLAPCLLAACDDGASVAPPRAPNDLKASLDDTFVHLSWTARDGAAERFVVRRSETAKGPFADVGEVEADPSVAALAFDDPRTPSSTGEHFYVVLAEGPGGRSGTSNQVKVTARSPAQDVLRVATLRPQTATLAWTPDPLASSYRIWILPQSDARISTAFDPATFRPRPEAITGAEQVLARAPADNQLVAVQALDAQGSALWVSNVVTVSGGPLAGRLHVSTAADRVALRWLPLATTPPGTTTEVTGYQVLRNDTPVGVVDGVDLLRTYAFDFEDLGLTVGVPVEYRVTTLVQGGQPGLTTPGVMARPRAWTRMAGNDALTCAVGSGALYCFQTRPPIVDNAIDDARNPYGMLGNGTLVAPEHRDLVPVPDLGTEVVDVALGDARICAAHTDGSVSCWGLTFDVVASPEAVNAPATLSPQPFAGLADVVALAAGAWHFCALHTDGGVSCWGDNDQGQLGRGTADTESHSTPERVPGLTGVTQLVAGYAHTCALQAEGTVVCWGAGDAVGQGARGVPVPIPVGVQREDERLLTGARQISSGVNQHATCALIPPSDVWCWSSAWPLARAVSRPGSTLYPGVAVERVVVGGWVDVVDTMELTLCDAEGGIWGTQWRSVPNWNFMSEIAGGCDAMTSNAGQLCLVDASGYLACRARETVAIFDAEP